MEAAKENDFMDFDEITGFTLERHMEWFIADATHTCVPLGVAILRFATLLQAIDHHLYATGQISQSEAREMIRNAASLMDKKFDMEYRKLPQ